MRSYKKVVRELNPTLDEATAQHFDEAQRTVVAAMGDLEEEPMPVAFNFGGRLGPGECERSNCSTPYHRYTL